MDQTTLKVSVIVPVFNTGKYIEDLIASLAAQSLPQDEFEVIFVDDGSTDGTPQRLDALVAERANVTVRHDPNSGWPGRPRNHGIDAARGKYVFFVDHDDWLGAEALARMTAFGEDNASDIVIGRQAGHRRGVAKPLFVKTLPEATLDNAPLMDSLTPHMMFRREFLDEHGLRFPEGRRRLEDHVFVTAAYFLAERISILADYHCYFHVRRDDDGNAAYRRVDPASYFRNVREVVEVVFAHTTPGSVRDKVLERSLRGELLGRLSGRPFLDADIGYGRELFDHSRGVVMDAIPESVDTVLQPALRVRSYLLRANRFDDLSACVEQELAMRLRLQLRALQWAGDGSLQFEVTGSLVDRNTGQPWRYRCDGDQVLVAGPESVSPPVPNEITECTEALRSAQLQIVLRSRADSEEWTIPVKSSFQLHGHSPTAWLLYRAVGRIDPLTLGGGQPLTPGIWDAYGRVTQTGWVKEARLGADRDPARTSDVPAAVLAGGLMVPYWTDPHGNLSLHVRANPSRLISQLRSDPHRAIVIDAAHRTVIVEVAVPLVTQPGAVIGATLRMSPAIPGVPIDLGARGTFKNPRQVSIRAALPKVPTGHWQLLLAMDVLDWGQFRPIGASLVVSRRRCDVVLSPDKPGARAPSAPARARAICRGLLGRARRRLRRTAITLGPRRQGPHRSPDRP
ncbi:MAG: glycosyltransferase [Jatrophihabitans sp.]